MLEKPERERGFKKERILRVLLSSKDSMTKYRVAKEAEVSEPWCREYTTRLEERRLLEDTKILDHEGIYEEWQDVHIEGGYIRVSLQNTLEFLKDTDLKYALTTYMGENLRQGYLFPSIIDLYVREDERVDWLNIVEKKGLIGGGNTRIRLNDDHIFYGVEKIDGLYVVSVPQLILDLRLEGGPCKDAAEKMMVKYHGVE